MAHKLLLADDSVTIQRVIELTFADEDVEVTAVGDGQLAIERLDADPPDIVLADVDMPKRDGYEVAAYVKSRPQLAHIPVVLLTGAFEPIDQARATAAGSSDVLAKPFEPQMVINRVKELLGKKRPQEPEGHTTAQSPRGGGPNAAAALGAPAPPPFGMPSHDNEMSGPGGANPMAQGQSSQPASLDDYFDQLDAAFSNLQPAAPRFEHDAMQSEEDWPMLESPPPAPQARASVPPAPVRPIARQSQVEQLITPPPFDTAQGAPSVSRGAARPAPVQPEWTPEPAVATARPAPPPALAPPRPPAFVPQSSTKASKPVAPAFAPGASASAPSGAAADKSAGKPVAPVAAPLITEELIQQVVMRVLLRMSDRVVRETVSEIVSKTAERLVQEEIEKIKNGGE